MRDTSSVGNKTEAMVLAALVHAGYSPLLPFGGGHPYDIALDQDGDLVRIQCKTGRLLKQGVVFFPTASWCRNMRYRSYRGDVDLFGVYCPGTREVYLVPIGDVPDRTAYLRVEPTKNGQEKGVRWAKDYVIWPERLGTADGLLGARASASRLHGLQRRPEGLRAVASA